MPTKVAALDLSPSFSPFSRLLAAIDRWLLAYAEMTIRYGDTPPLRRLVQTPGQVETFPT